MKTPTLLSLFFGLAGFVWLTGCGGGDGGSGSNSGGPFGNTNQLTQVTNIAGKTFSFTVTSAHGLSEPVGANYTIVFNDGTTYTFNPSPQNIEHKTNSVSGMYTFDASTTTVQLTSPGELVTGTLHFDTPTTGAIHWSELDGEMQDATFTEF